MDILTTSTDIKDRNVSVQLKNYHFFSLGSRDKFLDYVWGNKMGILDELKNGLGQVILKEVEKKGGHGWEDYRLELLFW